METLKVDEQTAEQEFDRFAEAMVLEVDESRMDEDEAKEFKPLKRTFIRAVQSGALVVNEDGEPELSLSKPVNDISTVRFREPKGADYMQADKSKKTESMKKFFMIMASMTDVPVNVYTNMRKRDLKVCQAITGLFMA